MAEEASGSNDINNVTNQLQSLCVTSNTRPVDPIYRDYFKKIDWMADLQEFQNLEMQVQRESIGATNEETMVSYVYLLLDGAILRDMPAKQNLESWTIFVKSVFYIGYGSKDSVAYKHVKSAKKGNSELSTSTRIRDIWNKNCGVVHLTVFRFISRSLAKEYKTAMMVAIGIDNLENERRASTDIIANTGEFIQQRKLGVYLLYKAMMNYLDSKAVVPLERRDV